MTAVYDQNTGQYVNQPTPQGAAPSGVGVSGSTYIQKPGSNETVQGQLTGLLSGNSAYIQNARKSGQQYVASRGLMNSSLGAQAGERAAINAAAPIAAQDAQIFSQASAQNADALNAIQVAELNRQAANASAERGYMPNLSDIYTNDQAFERQKEIMRLASELNISEAEAGRQFQREEGETDREFSERMAEMGFDFNRETRGSDQNFQREMTSGDRDWQREMAAAGRDFTREMTAEDRAWARENMTEEGRMSMFRDVMQMSMGTIFSSPDYFRDPAAASGFMDFFTGQFGSLFDSFFGSAPGGG